MNLITAATLVVLTAANGCKIDNIDRAQPTTFQVPSMEECEAKAAELDDKQGIRAFCIEATN